VREGGVRQGVVRQGEVRQGVVRQDLSYSTFFFRHLSNQSTASNHMPHLVLLSFDYGTKSCPTLSHRPNYLHDVILSFMVDIFYIRLAAIALLLRII